MNATEERPPDTTKVQSKDCPHLNFEAEVDVNRLTEKEGGQVNRFAADIRIRCADCGISCHFIGFEQGLSYRKAMTSIDDTELRCPLGIGPTTAAPWQTFEVTAAQVMEPDPMTDKESEKDFIDRAAAELRKGDSGT